MNKLNKGTISFNRGGDPAKTLGVGRLKRLREKYGKEDSVELIFNASAAGNLDDVKFLIQQEGIVENAETKLNLLRETSHINSLILQIGAENSHLNIVMYAIEREKNIPESINYSLRWAIRNGNLDMVKYLVEHGADVSDDNYRALKLSKDYEHLDIIDYLNKSRNK